LGGIGAVLDVQSVLGQGSTYTTESDVAIDPLDLRYIPLTATSTAETGWTVGYCTYLYSADFAGNNVEFQDGDVSNAEVTGLPDPAGTINVDAQLAAPAGSTIPITVSGDACSTDAMDTLGADSCILSVWQQSTDTPCPDTGDALLYEDTDGNLGTPSARFDVTDAVDSTYSVDGNITLNSDGPTRLCVYLDYLDSSNDAYSSVAVDQEDVALPPAPTGTVALAAPSNADPGSTISVTVSGSACTTAAMDGIGATNCVVSVWEFPSGSTCPATSQGLFTYDSPPDAVFDVTADADSTYSQTGPLNLVESGASTLCAYIDYYDSSTLTYTTVGTDVAQVGLPVSPTPTPPTPTPPTTTPTPTPTPPATPTLAGSLKLKAPALAVPKSSITVLVSGTACSTEGMTAVGADKCWVSVWQFPKAHVCPATSNTLYGVDSPAALFDVTANADSTYSQTSLVFLSQSGATKLCAYLDYVTTASNGYQTQSAAEAVVGVKKAAVKKKVIKKKVVHHKAKAKAKAKHKARFTG
jgi:hypothetical protein